MFLPSAGRRGVENRCFESQKEVLLTDKTTAKTTEKGDVEPRNHY
jgi:hypothetical protein